MLDVLRGVNIRDSTEMLTRKRLSVLNAAMIAQYVQIPGESSSVETFTQAVAEAIDEARLDNNQKWMLNWALGLTDKGRKNLLRDENLSSSGYVDRYLSVLRQAAEIAREEFGQLSGSIRVGERRVPLDWFFVLYVCSSIGEQTLTVRGSEKSLYGKLFEKLILGSALSVLGFRFTRGGPSSPSPGQFWLSSTSEGERESDATLLISPGEGVRFDIGFIGSGNTEISLDKVTRFRQEAEFNKRRYGMVTFIIVDRIGARSNLPEIAREVDGTVLQMSMTYWPKQLAQELHDRFGYEDEIVGASHREVHRLLEERLARVPLTELLERAEDSEE
ncbi:MAG: CfrBI family restriction endonuclease [Rubrobacter sp.]|nr:CfrBI family restriction endonuclease [Rubrobacter sp.]